MDKGQTTTQRETRNLGARRMRHSEVRLKAVELIQSMPEFPRISGFCTIENRKIAMRLLLSGIYKSHSLYQIEFAIPGLVKLSKKLHCQQMRHGIDANLNASTINL